MATIKKNVWFAALNKNGNIVDDGYGLALMGKKKADVQEEVNRLYPDEGVTVQKVEIEISRFF